METKVNMIRTEQTRPRNGCRLYPIKPEILANYVCWGWRKRGMVGLVLDKIVILNYLRIPIIRRVQLANTDTDSYRIPIVAIMVDEKIKLMNH